jgi:DNA-binding XRE family transcriptional regulator
MGGVTRQTINSIEKGQISPQPATGIQDCAHLWEANRGRVYLRGHLNYRPEPVKG